MKKILIILLFPSILFSQYSNYYQVDKNVRVSGNLNISTTERKTIRIGSRAVKKINDN